MLLLPFTLPAPDVAVPGGGHAAVDVDTGGYDVMIGGHGFRLATDTTYPYERATEATTVHRFDSSLEPGEQTLAALPWIKEQSSFHAGAGQLNLEQGFTAFQYQSEQIEHIRFDASLGVDPWTPGRVTRLPDTQFYSFGGADLTDTDLVTGASLSNGFEYAVVGGAGQFYQLVWASGPDVAPTQTNIDLSGVTFGGAANCTIVSLATDGLNYYATVALTVPVAGVSNYVVSQSLDYAGAPFVRYDCPTVVGTLGWQKSRLVAGLGPAMYELSPVASAHSVLPAPKYTHPISSWVWSHTAESPTGILMSGAVGEQSAILAFMLDTSGGTPVLAGGESAATMPIGQKVLSLDTSVGSFLTVGTNAGIRIGTFDTYSGALKLGPISVATPFPVFDVTSRDRFVYGGYTNAQADGSTGLVRIDLSMVIDVAGRNAYAADLRPPTTAPHSTGTVLSVGRLAHSGRIIFITTYGLHVEGNGPGADGDAWLRTSRIRYGTGEDKLFKLGRVRGTLDVSEIQVTGIAPFASDQNLGTFGFISDGDPGEFRLPVGLHEWIQLKLDLIGSACILNTYQVKALPAPHRQHMITFTVNCFQDEVDRFGLSVTDPEQPRKRLANVQALEAYGDELRFVEFTNQGSVAELVVIDQLAFRSMSRPSITSDFGGYITFSLRATEGA